MLIQIGLAVISVAATVVAVAAASDAQASIRLADEYARSARMKMIRTVMNEVDRDDITQEERDRLVKLLMIL